MHRSETHASFLGATSYSVVRHARFCGAEGFKMMRDALCWDFAEAALLPCAVCNYLCSVA